MLIFITSLLASKELLIALVCLQMRIFVHLNIFAIKPAKTVTNIDAAFSNILALDSLKSVNILKLHKLLFFPHKGVSLQLFVRSL